MASIKFPEITKLDNKNQFSINWGKLKIKDLQENFSAQVFLYWQGTKVCTAYYLPENMQFPETIVQSNNIKKISFNNQTESFSLKGFWNYGEQFNYQLFTKYFINPELYSSYNYDYDYVCKIEVKNKDVELYKQGLTVDTSGNYNITAYPEQTNNDAELMVSSNKTTLIKQYFSFFVFKEQENVKEFKDFKKIEKKVETYDYVSTHKNNSSKVVLAVKIFNDKDQLVDLNGKVIDGVEFTQSIVKYLNYEPTVEERRFDIRAWVDQIDLKPVDEQFELKTYIENKTNKSLLSFNWEDLSLNEFTERQPYQYELFPYYSNESYQHYSDWLLVNYNKKINSHLNDYYNQGYLPHIYKEGNEIKTLWRRGHIINNNAPKNELAYNLPLPIDISQKNKNTILTWDGTISKTGVVGKGTKEEPYILKTPSHFAWAVLKNYEERYLQWLLKDAENLAVSKKEYFEKELWRTNEVFVYYEVDSNVYAFNMNGFSGIELNLSPEKLKNIFKNKDNKNTNMPYWQYKEIIETNSLNNETVIISAQAQGFSGSIKGNGIIIYNLNAETENEIITSAALIPEVLGCAIIKEIIVKHSSFLGGGDDNFPTGVGALVGRHGGNTTGYGITESTGLIRKKYIEISLCASIGNKLQGYYPSTIVANLVGNAGSSDFVLYNSVSYFNIIPDEAYFTSDKNGNEKILSIGGIVGAFSRASLKEDGKSSRPNPWYCQADSEINAFQDGLFMLGRVLIIGNSVNASGYTWNSNWTSTENDQIYFFWDSMDYSEVQADLYTQSFDIWRSDEIYNWLRELGIEIIEDEYGDPGITVDNFRDSVAPKRYNSFKALYKTIIDENYWAKGWEAKEQQLPKANKKFNIDLKAIPLTETESWANSYDNTNIIGFMIKAYYLTDKEDEPYYGSELISNYEFGSVPIQRTSKTIRFPTTPTFFIKRKEWFQASSEIFVKTSDGYKKAISIYLKQPDGKYKKAF